MATVRTVRQIIEGAFRIIGVHEVGETPEPEDTATALETLQDIIAEHAGSWIIPFIVQQAITLVAGQASYTIGENGAPGLNTQRPEQINGAFIRSGGYDYPVNILGERAYRTMVDKTTSGRPEWLWYNPTAPNGTIYVYPVPDDATDALWISSAKSLAEPTGLTQNMLDTVSIPRNYHNPLKKILALELCEEYGKPPSQLLMVQANESESRLLSLNAARMVSPAMLEVPGINPANGRSILSF